MSSRQTIIKFLSGKYADITSGIYSGSAVLTEILDDGEQLNFKGCNANSFEVKISNLADKAVIGEKISVCQKIENEEIQLFTGIIDSAELQGDKTYRKLIAYDELYGKSSVNITEWYAKFFNGKSNVTLKTFRDALFEYIGIEQVSTTLANDNIAVKNTAAGTIKFGDMVSNICELNGVFGNINRYGKFEYVSLDEKTAVDITDNVRSNGKILDYTVMPVTRVELYTDKESNAYAAGTGNSFIVNGNSLLYGKTKTELKQIALNLLNKIKKISYIPVEISTIVSDTSLIPGTKVSFTTHSGKTITSYVMRNKLYNVQMFKQDITANGSETRSETIENNDADLDVLQRAIIMKLDAYEAEITYATITNLDAVKARVTSLEATEITTTYLESNYAKIDLANIKDGCITSAMIGTGVVGTAQIADGSITDAKIVGLTANKITAGVLDAGERVIIMSS